MKTITCKKTLTLVEVLVILAIIAVLLSLLFPSLSRARKSARFASCASQQKQIGIAFHMFAEDNLKKLPHGANAANSKAGSWEIRIAPYMGINYDQSYINDALSHTSDAEKLAPINNAALKCPEDSRTDGNNFVRSYAVNSFFRWVPHKRKDRPGHGVFSRKAIENDLKTTFLASNSLFLLESAPTSSTAHIHQGCAWYSALANDTAVTFLQFPTHNSSRANFLFADGHVDSRTRNHLEINNYNMLKTRPNN